MKASEFIKILEAAIAMYGDLRLVVGYDSAHADIDPRELEDGEESWNGGSYGFGPRNLVLDFEHEHSGTHQTTRCFRI